MMTTAHPFAKLILASLMATAAVASPASTISFQTRNSIGSALPTGADYRNTIEGLMSAPASSGYCDSNPSAWNGLSNQTNCGGLNGDIAFDITAKFGVSSSLAGLWSFRVGPDFGLGGALFIDGNLVDFRSSDMWWNGVYTDPSQLLVATLNLSAGNHVIEAYGLEHCCDGAQQAQFLAPAATDWNIFSTGDGLNAINGVPEPGSLALLAISLLALAAKRSRA